MQSDVDDAPRDTESAVDEASEESFPASDPVSPFAHGNGQAGKPHHVVPDRVPDRPSKPTRVVLEDGRETYVDHGHVVRSEEHTSELQSRQYLVCRLLLEKKNKTTTIFTTTS